MEAMIDLFLIALIVILFVIALVLGLMNRAIRFRSGMTSFMSAASIALMVTYAVKYEDTYDHMNDGDVRTAVFAFSLIMFAVFLFVMFILRGIHLGTSLKKSKFIGLIESLLFTVSTAVLLVVLIQTVSSSVTNGSKPVMDLTKSFVYQTLYENKPVKSFLNYFSKM